MPEASKQEQSSFELGRHVKKLERGGTPMSEPWGFILGHANTKDVLVKAQKPASSEQANLYLP